MNKRKKTDTHCFAPGCKSGYPDNTSGRSTSDRKPSLFRAPKEESRKLQWERNLKRKDKRLADTSAVCERHFEPHLILRDYVHTVNGEEVRISRGRPVLAEDAVPTLLPDFPAYHSKELPRERPRRKRTATAVTLPVKKARQSRRDIHELSISPPDEPDKPNPIGAQESAFVEHLKLPTKFWSRIYIPKHSGVIYATSRLHKNDSAVISHEKLVSFAPNNSGLIVAQCFLHGRGTSETEVRTVEEAERVLQEADCAILCRGAMPGQEFKELSQKLTVQIEKSLRTVQGTAFSEKCTGKITAGQTMCVACRYLRKSLLSRKSRLKTKRPIRMGRAQRLKASWQKTK
ncbi:unnamed protein product, partial [Ixodes hexagonus]